ncbi:MAG: hypothetical protein ACFCUJ_12050 [Thiotrichales bacterium]
MQTVPEFSATIGEVCVTRRIRFMSCLSAALLLAATGHVSAHSSAYRGSNVDIVIDLAFPLQHQYDYRPGPPRRASRSHEGYTHPRQDRFQRYDRWQDRGPGYRSNAGLR